MTKRIKIKKYANRRLYDTVKSEYITLDQVSEMIRQGCEVQVVDAKTGEDMTAFILTQIVMENARSKNVLLPIHLLHLIIRYGDNILDEFFDTYLSNIIAQYIKYKSSMDQQFQEWLDMGMEFSDLAKKSMANLSPFNPFFSSKDADTPDSEDRQD